ncbi:hypothetical protein [Hymenobacter volaticus]|uniref:HAMP domain-containing histidine kinase n=1 Tax=Hymenobacter volaticus TaxID=2932254 RepID=A0ABY4GF92_9BACT|nr:hypothetical protein [Hymenobacter volaticus]UOQ69610.1 hypothetical protein MUN86_29340 [Hymenobacter volaticus]
MVFDLSKSQRARVQPAEAVDVMTLLDDVRYELGPLLTTSEADLTVELTTCPTICFAPLQLRTIVEHLLRNALQYRSFDRPAQVAVRTYSCPGYTVLEV